MVEEIRIKYPYIKIWLYTGYTFEYLIEHRKDSNIDEDRFKLMCMCDILVDGKFVKKLASTEYHWAGSTNQRIIDVKKTLYDGEVVLY